MIGQWHNFWLFSQDAKFIAATWGAVMNTKNRKHRRKNVHFDVALANTAGITIGTCTVANISEGGAHLTQLESAEIPEKFYLLLTHGGTVRRLCEVAWRKEGEVGVKFILPNRKRD